ncbi:MAG: hypothetical protein O7D35_09770, partial [Acidobacteria bacterium]|nr:hypothetical protein [Acidobacteriota bacterium]
MAEGTSPDTNGNGVPDECDVDCDGNGVSDDIDIAEGTRQDCNFNGVPDLCDVDGGFSNDVNGNKIP